MISTVLVDLDGVVCDFIGAAARLFYSESEAKERLARFRPGLDIADVLEITKGQLWKKIDSTPDFWYNLEKFDHCDEMMSYLHSLNVPVFVCTSPSQNPNCIVGKMNWLQKHKIVQHRNYVVTPHKFLMAKPDVLLIDDDDGKCAKFEEYGGLVCKMPQLWNLAHDAKLSDGRPAINNKLDYIKEQVNYYND